MIRRRYLILACLVVVNAHAQNGPQPGDVYREYAVNLKVADNWRVTDPNAGAAGAAEFLPNPLLSIQIDDLDKVVRAEVLMDIWGGHPGTSGKQFRFNSNNWINIPRVPTLVISSQCYMKEYNVILDLPLEYIHEGENTFEGNSAGQVCGNFNWGQWGWYVMMVRVYYQPDKAHTSGQISHLVSGDTISDNPVISVATTDTGSVSSIQILGHYYGYDEDGDGIYKDWHRAYHGEEISGHIGTIEESPFQHTWNTRYIPDQKAGAVSFMARIQDTSGIWFVSDVVPDLTLKRPDSLKVLMHKPYDVPEQFWVRAGKTRQCYININEADLATEAILYHRTWNAGDDESAGGTIEKPLRVNGHSYKCYGKNHSFDLSSVRIAAGDLVPGPNKISYVSNTVHHGIEILWPGPAIVVRYVTGVDTISNPVFSPPDGHIFQGTLNLSILYETDGRQVYYTSDGTDPNPSDNRYRGQALKTDSDITFKARAFKQDYYESDVVSASYDLVTILENNSLALKLYCHPNPAIDRLYMDIPSELGNGNYSIFDLEGRMVLTGQAAENLIETGQLSNGAFFLMYESTQGIFTARFIVQR